MKAVLILLAAFLLAACGSSRQEFTPTATKTPIPSVAPAKALATETPIAPTVILVITATPTSQPPTPQPPTITVPPPTVEVIPTAPNIEPSPTATLTQPAALPQATANDIANLRSGPGTDFAIVGSVAAGQALTIIGRNSASDWYQLGDGAWIAAFLVNDAPADVAVTDGPELQPTAVPAVVEQPTAAPVQPTNSPFTCIGGCATPPDASCSIKGNVNSSGEKIYHTTDSSFYSRTDIHPEEGDRWFCTVQEAEDAGFRAPRNRN